MIEYVGFVTVVGKVFKKKRGTRAWGERWAILAPSRCRK